MTSYSLEGADAMAQLEKLKAAGGLEGGSGEVTFTRTTKTTTSSGDFDGDFGGGFGGGSGGGGKTVTKTMTTGDGGEIEITRLVA